MRQTKRFEYICIGIATVIVIIFCHWLACRDVEAKSEPTLRQITATAYYDSYGHGKGADGRKLVDGLTIAGRVEDLGKTAVLYDEDMRLIGIYEFRDTGYGRATGKGKSQILRGKTKGDIETGECVDIYMSTRAKCNEWGRRKVYIQIVNAKG